MPAALSVEAIMRTTVVLPRVPLTRMRSGILESARLCRQF